MSSLSIAVTCITSAMRVELVLLLLPFVTSTVCAVPEDESNKQWSCSEERVNLARSAEQLGRRGGGALIQHLHCQRPASATELDSAVRLAINSIDSYKDVSITANSRPATNALSKETWEIHIADTQARRDTSTLQPGQHWQRTLSSSRPYWHLSKKISKDFIIWLEALSLCVLAMCVCVLAAFIERRTADSCNGEKSESEIYNSHKQSSSDEVA